jgi:hypothetical protein
MCSKDKWQEDEYLEERVTDIVRNNKGSLSNEKDVEAALALVRSELNSVKGIEALSGQDSTVETLISGIMDSESPVVSRSIASALAGLNMLRSDAFNSSVGYISGVIGKKAMSAENVQQVLSYALNAKGNQVSAQLKRSMEKYISGSRTSEDKNDLYSKFASALMQYTGRLDLEKRQEIFAELLVKGLLTENSDDAKNKDKVTGLLRQYNLVEKGINDKETDSLASGIASASSAKSIAEAMAASNNEVKQRVAAVAARDEELAKEFALSDEEWQPMQKRLMKDVYGIAKPDDEMFGVAVRSVLYSYKGFDGLVKALGIENYSQDKHMDLVTTAFLKKSDEIAGLAKAGRMSEEGAKLRLTMLNVIKVIMLNQGLLDRFNSLSSKARIKAGVIGRFKDNIEAKYGTVNNQVMDHALMMHKNKAKFSFENLPSMDQIEIDIIALKQEIEAERSITSKFVGKVKQVLGLEKSLDDEIKDIFGSGFNATGDLIKKSGIKVDPLGAGAIVGAA